MFSLDSLGKDFIVSLSENTLMSLAGSIDNFVTKNYSVIYLRNYNMLQRFKFSKL